MRPREVQLTCARHMANKDSEPEFKFQVFGSEIPYFNK